MADSPDRDEQEQASAQDGNSAAESAADSVAAIDEAVEQGADTPAGDDGAPPEETADVEASATVEANDAVEVSDDVEASDVAEVGDDAEASHDESADAASQNEEADTACEDAAAARDDADAPPDSTDEPDALDGADAAGDADTVDGDDDAEDRVAAASTESAADADGAAADAGGADDASDADDVSSADDVSGAESAAATDGADAADDASLEAGAGTDDEAVDEDLGRATADLKSIVEALIFASPEPLTPKALMKLLDSEPKEDVLAALDAVKTAYEEPSGLQLVEVAGGFQIVTRSDLHEWVRRLFHERSTQKLSVQALETLAVIAYRQPITALEITEIRGVSASGVLNTLLERHLVKIVGRKQVVGRPFMYATTKEFLIRFGLKDLTDLPKVEDMAESLGIESPLLVEQTPPEEQLPLSEPEAEDSGQGGELTASDAGDEPEDDDSGEPTIN